MLIAGGLSIPPARAGYVVTLEQVETSVVASGGGPIDSTALSRFASGLVGTRIVPSIADILTGPATTGTKGIGVDSYRGFSGPTEFGSGGGSSPSNGSGPGVGIHFLNNVVFVSKGYVSGSPLSDSMTFDNQTFASLGVTPGTYEMDLGNRAEPDFTVNIVAAAVSEPASVFPPEIIQHAIWLYLR